MAQEYTAEIGRALGWDLAYYGWNPREDAPGDVMEGHAAGKAHHGSRTKNPTRFERKWLQLRQNALRRGRVVDEGITAKYIEAIDHPICPVTLCEMTHGAGLDSDWSVDRLNNDGAYADGNLVVMSVRANQAKDRKGFFEVSDIVKANRDMNGLTAKEWARLKCIMLGACNTGNTLGGEFPLVTRIPNRCTRPPYHQLQHITLLLAAAESTRRNAGMRELNRVQVDKNARSLLQLAVERLRTVLKTVDYKYDACCDTAFQNLLARWVERIPVANQAVYKKTLQSMVGGENLSARTIQNWSLGTSGYLTR